MASAGMAGAQGYYNADVRLRESWSEMSGGTTTIEFREAPHRGKAPEQVIEYSITWKPVDEWGAPAVGHGLLLSGQLAWRPSQGGPLKGVDWLEGVRVLISKQPDVAMDWTHGHEALEVAWSDVVVRTDGSFLALVPFHSIERPIGAAGLFQVAASVTQRAGSILEWAAANPVVADSIRFLEVPGAKPLPPTLEKINGVSGPRAESFDPVALITAVHHLQALGKEPALQALEEYLKVCPGRPPFDEIPTRNAKNIDHGDPQAVFLIVRMLFEPADPLEALPRMMIGAPEPPQPPDLDCPLFPLIVESGIPFLLVDGWDLGGHPEDPRRHIDWARRRGRLKEVAPHPSRDPWAAADELMQKLPPNHRRYGDMIQDQVMTCLEDLVPADARGTHSKEDLLEWTRALSQARRIVFDRSLMHFVIAPQ